MDTNQDGMMIQWMDKSIMNNTNICCASTDNWFTGAIRALHTVHTSCAFQKAQLGLLPRFSTLLHSLRIDFHFKVLYYPPWEPMNFEFIDWMRMMIPKMTLNVIKKSSFSDDKLQDKREEQGQ